MKEFVNKMPEETPQFKEVYDVLAPQQRILIENNLTSNVASPKNKISVEIINLYTQ